MHTPTYDDVNFRLRPRSKRKDCLFSLWAFRNPHTQTNTTNTPKQCNSCSSSMQTRTA